MCFPRRQSSCRTFEFAGQNKGKNTMSTPGKGRTRENSKFYPSRLVIAGLLTISMTAGCMETTNPIYGPGNGGGPGSRAPIAQQDYSFFLQNMHGLCLDAAGQTAKQNGGKIQVWQCQSNNPNQTWYFENGAIVNEHGGCLDAAGETAKRNGGKVQIWTCQNNNPNQTWYFQGDSIINEHGLCLDVDGHSATKNGGRVQVWQCQNNNPNQNLVSELSMSARLAVNSGP